MPSLHSPQLVERVNDPRLQWTRLRVARRLLALVIVLSCAVFAIGVVTDGALLFLGGALGVGVANTLLNFGTRGLMELPVHLLDERQRDLRDRCQVVGLRALQAVVPLALTVVALLVATGDRTRLAVGIAVGLVPLVALTSRLASAWVLEDEDAADAHELAVRAEDVRDRPGGRARFFGVATLYALAGAAFGIVTSRIGQMLAG